MVEVNGFKISVMVTQLGSNNTGQPDCYNSIGVYRLAVKVCRQVIVVYGARVVTPIGIGAVITAATGFKSFDYRPCACVGVVHILYLKVYDFPHTRRHFVGQWNSSNVHVDPFLAPYQQY